VIVNRAPGRRNREFVCVGTSVQLVTGGDDPFHRGRRAPADTNL